MKRPFLKGMLIGTIIGLVVGVAVAFVAQDRLYDMWRPMDRLREAADSSEYTYALYLHAPFPVAEEFLNRQASLLGRLAMESADDGEREMFQWELAVNRTRLAKLANETGEDERARLLMGEAMVHVGQSNRSTTEQELVWYVDQIDDTIGKRSDDGPTTPSHESEKPDA